MTAPKFQPVPAVDPAITQLLCERGYTLLDKLGEGATRQTWRAAFHSGSLNQLRVVQIPKAITEESSVTTRQNFANGRNLDEREVLLTNEIEHPNIISILDAFDYNGRTITAQPYFDAVSLADYVQHHGTLTDPKKFVKVFAPITRGLAYAAEKGRVHRDVKPENMLISTRTDAVKMGDWQNTGDIHGDARILPTRGGAFTLKPATLQAIIEGTPIRPSFSQDIFALGASMYFALTGKPLFDQKIVEYTTPEGVTRLAVKTDDGTSIGFDNERYTKRIAEAIVEVPRRFRPILRATLTTDDSIRYWTVSENLDELQKPYFVEQLKTIRRYATPFLVATGIAAGVVAGGISMYRNDDRIGNENVYGMGQQITRSAFSNGTPETLLHNADTSTLATIVKTASTAATDSVKANALFSVYDSRLMSMNGINLRFAYAVARAIAGAERSSPPGSLPELWGRYDDYMRMIRSDDLSSVQEAQWANLTKAEMRRREITTMGETLRRCQALSELDDALACYLLSDESRDAAARASDVNHYGVRMVGTVQGVFPIPGYREKLAPRDRELVDRGIAHYLMADKDGGMTRNNVSLITRELIEKRHSK